MRNRYAIRYAEITCFHCGAQAKRPVTSINRAKLIKRPIFCDISCFGKYRRKIETPEARTRRLNKAYGREKRHRASLLSYRKPFEPPFPDALYLKLEDLIRDKYKLTYQEAAAAVQVLRGRERKAGAENMGLKLKTFEKHKQFAHIKLNVWSGLQCIVKLMPYLVRMQDKVTKDKRRLAPARKIVRAMDITPTDLPIGKMT